MSVEQIELTHFCKSGGPLTKQISLAADGSIISDGSQCVMLQGWAKREVFPASCLHIFADLTRRLGSAEAWALGALRADLPDEVEVVTKRKLNGSTCPGIISRTQDYIVYRPGAPGLDLLDFDSKGIPAVVEQRIEEKGGFWAAVVSVIPELKNVGRIERASTSAGLYNQRTGEKFHGSNGRHIYVLIKDSSDAERFLTALHERCWLTGFGWMIIGRAGQYLERSIVDRVCGTPERLVFEGQPVLIDPVAQDEDARQPVVCEGDPLDTLAACPPLTIVENARLRELRAKEKGRLGAAAAAAKERFIAEQSKRLAERRGIEINRARKIIERQCHGVLLPDVGLEFDDPELGSATVADVLTNPAIFEGATLADPLEGIEYGRGKARIMRNSNGTMWIHSFAHGRTIYELKLDYAAVRTALERAAQDDVADAFIQLVLAADLREDEIELLKHLAANRAGIGVRLIAAMLKAARKQQATRKAQQERERRAAERRDPRPQIPAPLPDAEWLPQMAVINEILSRCPASEPPTRDFEGFLNTCRATRAPGLHSLTSAGASATEADEDRIPPPEHLRLTRLDEVEAAELIERHIEYVDAKGEKSVHLHHSFIKHYFKRREDPALPRLYTIVQMPLVLPNGKILTGQGLNRDMNAIFRVPKTLKVPDPAECTPSAVSAAMRFLTDDWLCDVNTSYLGKCIIIALCETIIERALLPLRPGFFVSGGKRGGGKTTTLNMASMATLGTVAPAAAWSPSEEERRKAVLSYFLEDDPFVVFDNIKRGFVVYCPHIERALTAEFFADRILGASERRIVPVTTVFAWTGNKIGPRGDLSSRILSTIIDVDRPDPENRPFKHPDPIGWTAANRGKVLVALYTLLLGNPRRNQLARERTPAPTRFKAWWDLIGSAIEFAAHICVEEEHHLVANTNPACPVEEIDFAKTLIDTEADDDETSGLAELLASLEKRWPGGFMSRNLAARFSPDDCPPLEEDRNMQSCLERAAGHPLRPVSSNSISAALRKMTDSPVRLDDETTLVLRCTRDKKNGDKFRVEFQARK